MFWHCFSNSDISETVFCCLLYSRFKEVLKGLDDAITEMQRSAEELRNAASEHFVEDEKYHQDTLFNFACFRMVEIAASLNDTALKLQYVYDGPSPLSDVVDDHLAMNSDDSTDEWEWFEENSKRSMTAACSSSILEMCRCRCMC
jgi:hypothetical protein